jgi:hypothetical protein
MRSPATSLVLGLCLTAVPADAQQSATQHVQARVHFDSRTSLSVTSSTLQFHHADPARATVVTIDFTARARTHASGEVILTVEPQRALEGPGGAADLDAEVSFNTEGDGTRLGTLAGRAPSIVGRWTGSGERGGRISFSLRAAARGDYSVPLRFVLTAP